MKTFLNQFQAAASPEALGLTSYEKGDKHAMHYQKFDPENKKPRPVQKVRTSYGKIESVQLDGLTLDQLKTIMEMLTHDHTTD